MRKMTYYIMGRDMSSTDDRLFQEMVMPAYNPIFLSHGAPTLLTGSSQAKAFLSGFKDVIGEVLSLLVISAHWESDILQITHSDRPETIHDFRGFGPELEKFEWPVPGHKALAETVRDLFMDNGIKVDLNETRGLDHGVWVPMALVWPEAEIPTVQLSLPARTSSPDRLARVGEALAKLGNSGTLVVFSGSLTHSLRDALSAREDDPQAGFALDFAEPVRRAISKGDLDTILNWRSLPQADHNHPTPEHFHPLIMAAAMGGGPGTQLHESWTHSALAMDVWGWPLAA